jgi:adenosylcobinamide-phosphate synthase
VNGEYSLLFGWKPLSFWWLPPLAVLLDACLGDPPRWPHPVRFLAWCAGKLESFFRPRLRAFLAGAVAALVLLLFTGITVAALLRLPLLVGGAAALYCAFSGLALGQLLREGSRALSLLESGATEAARHAVQQLVSRDLRHAETPELSRGLAESLSENLNDAFVAPFFWFMAGGPVGLWLYKAASTLDSLWGYPHEPWKRFGTFAARLDDGLAFIPARLTAFFLWIAAWLLSWRTPWPGWARVAKDARSMSSPNAGWPMAAAAWLLGSGMGGPAVYAGVLTQKPRLGPDKAPWTAEQLRRLLKLTRCAGFLAAGTLWCVALALAVLAGA